MKTLKDPSSPLLTVVSASTVPILIPADMQEHHDLPPRLLNNDSENN